MSYALALDMTLRNTGWTVFQHENGVWFPEAGGCIRTKNEKATRKLFQMEEDIRAATEVRRGLLDLTDEWNPVMMVVERLDGTQTSTQARTFGLVEATFMGVFEETDIPYRLISATDAKVHMTGKKTATKNEMAQAVINMYPEYVEANVPKATKGAILKKYIGWSEHIFDSVCIFETAKASQEIRTFLKMAAK